MREPLGHKRGPKYYNVLLLAIKFECFVLKEYSEKPKSSKKKNKTSDYD